MKQTFTGGCHCGAVRFQVNADLAAGTVKCNCSICRKTRAWLAAVAPTDFKLVSGSEALTSYTFNKRQIQHLFCKHCGVKSFGRVQGPDGNEFVAVMVNCLDGLSDDERVDLPVMYVDGRNDDFESAPQQTRHL